MSADREPRDDRRARPPASVIEGSGRGRGSLVDGAEQAVRSWLAPGRYRQGDRLPPEHELAGMLGISRGTLRTALRRLELNGEIVRRQGSGTYVGRIAAARALGEQWQRLESYSSVARRQGIALGATDVQVRQERVGPPADAMLALEAEQSSTVISRTLVADRAPIAITHDVFHPGVPLPDNAALTRTLQAGHTSLDVLARAGLAVTWSRTVLTPVMVLPGSEVGQRLCLDQPTACLQMQEVVFAGQNDPVLFSRDLFTPGGLEVEVVRSVDAPLPAPVTASARRA